MRLGELPVNVAEAVLSRVFAAFGLGEVDLACEQPRLVEKAVNYHETTKA